MSSNIRVKRICEYCGKEFEARTTVTKTCSDACAKRAYKARKKAERIDASNEHTRKIIEYPIEVIKQKDGLNIADASKLLGVSRWTIWRNIKAGNLNAGKIGRRTVIRRADLDKLFNQSTIQQTSEPVAVSLSDCYTLKEVREKYGISDKALSELIRRNAVPKQYSGIYAYVPRAIIDELFNRPTQP
ncbi:helix-turn-helix domain-containing protein [Arsenicibacter rosenii]|uniref:DNA-binding protein n=1 Tax=Arsenicibacter rosenii TaxID=1750698 RepID=A0A1S2VJK6_9BACT|nr:helix-turn-helix domain-containing protein [Arsenicibacter rosenii]OIN58008.1 DNA-binding protein [Arsenicibacter rosenii]